MATIQEIRYVDDLSTMDQIEQQDLLLQINQAIAQHEMPPNVKS